MSAQTDAEPRLVRPEERDDPAEVRLADGRIGRPLRRLVGREGVESASWHDLSLPARTPVATTR